MNSNLALQPTFVFFCGSVVHNASQQQDRDNYHNQTRAPSISGELWGVNEAERRGRRRERWISAWQPDGGRWGGKIALLLPKQEKLRHIINHSRKNQFYLPSPFVSSLSFFQYWSSRFGHFQPFNGLFFHFGSCYQSLLSQRTQNDTLRLFLGFGDLSNRTWHKRTREDLFLMNHPIIPADV